MLVFSQMQLEGHSPVCLAAHRVRAEGLDGVATLALAVPPMMVAVVMVLQPIGGCSDRGGRGPVHVRRPVEARCRRRGF
jgi:hypothetical protein